MAYMASLILRESFFSRVSSTFLTNCWVMVLAPSTAFPARITLIAARNIASIFIPGCSKNVVSSMATSASMMRGGISSNLA